jgi:hypothetical protein
MAKAKKPTNPEVSEPAKAPARKPKGFALPPVRGSAEWGEWVGRLADHDRSSYPDLVDRALAAYAKQAGFKDAPPKR